MYPVELLLIDPDHTFNEREGYVKYIGDLVMMNYENVTNVEYFDANVLAITLATGRVILYNTTAVFRVMIMKDLAK